MKIVLTLVLFISSLNLVAQKIDSIKVPRGVRYKYCDPAAFEKAKELIKQELGNQPQYALMDRIVFVGPVLWSRYKKVKELAKIEGGTVTLLVDDKQLSGKMTQDVNDSKKVWNQFRKELNGVKYTLRKAKPDELIYYWSIISFDIEEPLMILETSERRYILDISADDLKIEWIEEMPK